MKSWLEKSYIEIYSTHNEGKSVIAERFIRNLKNKSYKYMTSISKSVYIDKLDYIVNKYNNTYHSTIEMKSVDVKSSTYINSSKKKLMMKVLSYVPNWSEEVYVVKKVKNTVPRTYVISDLKEEEIAGTF